MKTRLLLILLLISLLAPTAHAGKLFGKKARKSTETDRVPELVNVIKTDGDEDKRAEAARELRDYDPAKYPYLVPILVDALLSDKKATVRAEAAQSLGKVRPISQQAGQALEEALSKDSSMRVRLQARTALMQYHWAGYHSTSLARESANPLIQQSKEPPLAEPTTGPAAPPVSSSVPPSSLEQAPPRFVPQVSSIPLSPRSAVSSSAIPESPVPVSSSGSTSPGASEPPLPSSGAVESEPGPDLTPPG